ncbi:MAG TPA: lysylphosphatidylglycerol synthase transmembrane domain-containing protein, partial [bacterium]|nr:lysylphosphatidylglycerol synthase transmembrane domain-containing protein [bacterium]
NIKALLGLVVTVVLFWLLFRQVDVLLFLRYLAESRWSYVLAGVVLYLSSFIVRGLRWRVLLGHLKKVPLPETIRLVMAGYAVNNVLPGRIGEFTRAYLAGNRNGISRTAVFASIFVERVFDGLTVFLILAALLFTYPFPGWVRVLAETAGLLFVSLFLFILFSSFSDLPVRFIRAMEERVPRWLALPLTLLEKFMRGTRAIESLGQLAMVLILSFAVWSVELGVYVLIVKAFGVQMPVIAYLLMLVTVNMGMLIPSTPGGLGVFQFAVVKSLEIFAVMTTLGMAVALVLHMAQIVPVTIIGIVWLWRNHVSIASLEKEKRDEGGNGAT